MTINSWGNLTTLTNLTKPQVIDIVLGKPVEGKKYLNSIITITEEGTGKTQKIDTTDDFDLFGIEFAPGY
jgi:hypothetical protein